MKIAGLKSLVLAALTPSVDSILANFTNIQDALKRVASVQTERGNALLQKSKRLRDAASDAFVEVERAERLCAKLDEFLGK